MARNLTSLRVTKESVSPDFGTCSGEVVRRGVAAPGVAAFRPVVAALPPQWAETTVVQGSQAPAPPPAQVPPERLWILYQEPEKEYRWEVEKTLFSPHNFAFGEIVGRKTKKYRSAEGEKDVVFTRPCTSCSMRGKGAVVSRTYILKYPIRLREDVQLCVFALN